MDPVLEVSPSIQKAGRQAERGLLTQGAAWAQMPARLSCGCPPDASLCHFFFNQQLQSASYGLSAVDRAGVTVTVPARPWRAW